LNKEKILSNICPIKDCGRPTYKGSKYCIFHAKPEEKTEEEFKKALEKYIEKIKENNLDYNFIRFIFVGDIDFERDFNIITFKNANFGESTFSGSTFFIKSAFKGYTDFSNVTFEGEIKLWDITFETKVDFRGAIFKENAEFIGIIFKGLTDFRHVIFERNIDFERITFKEDAKFDDSTFQGNLSFKYANLSPIKELYLRVKKKGIISFEYTFLENVHLNLDLDKGVLIDFTNSLLRNTKIEKDQIENHILQEEKKTYLEAKEIYLLLKNNFHSIGRYRDESWAFTKERDMEKMSKSFCSLLDKYKKYSLFKKMLKKSNLLKRVIVKSKIFRKWLFSKKAIEWFDLSFSNFIYQYGENPWRVIRFALIIIFLFAIILNFSGIVISDRTNLIIEFIKKSQGDEYALRYFGPILGSFLNCLYFSVVTFTTLGYGDFQPAVGLSRFFVSLESIIGAITMALFVYTFARRTGGR
jgi:uncharacterized protein YjbI with pentapeptide repeats